MSLKTPVLPPPAHLVHGLRSRLASEAGFTLIEVLVVILVIGILSSIALASYLSQANKGQDAAAKSQIKSLQNRVEDCAAERDAYDRCDTGAELDDMITGINFSEPTATPPKEKVSVESASERSYKITGTSVSGNSFSVARGSDGGFARTCTPKGKAGCRDEGGTGVW